MVAEIDSSGFTIDFFGKIRGSSRKMSRKFKEIFTDDKDTYFPAISNIF